MKTPIRIFVHHRHSLPIAGLIRQLEGDPRFRPIGVSDDAGETLRMLVAQPADILLIEPRPRGVHLPEMIRKLKEKFPELKILPTELDREKHLRDCRAAGASGYVPHNTPPVMVLPILLRVHQGEEYWPKLPRASATRRILTPRQIEILEHVAEHESNREIGEKLGISELTVKTQMHEIQEKLAVEGRHRAVDCARILGILPPL